VNELEQSLIRWAQAGLVSVDQARTIRDYEQSGLPESDDFGVSLVGEVSGPATAGQGQPPAVDSKPAPDRSAIATEAIAYVGGMLFLIGYGVVLGTQWESLNSFARFVVFLLPAVLTFVAGLGFGNHTVESFRRIGFALWGLAAGFFASAVTVAYQDFVDLSDNLAIVLGAVTVAVLTFAQYVFRRSMLQQLVAFVSLAVVLCSLLAWADDDLPLFWFGLLVMTQGLGWLMFTWAEVIRPRWAGIVLGAGGALVATQVMAASMTDPALVIGLVLSAVFIIAGVLASMTVLFTIGSIGLFVIAYEGVLAWIGSSVITNSILLVLGVVILGAVVVRLQLKSRS
jgi:hypothetical protein